MFRAQLLDTSVFGRELNWFSRKSRMCVKKKKKNIERWNGWNSLSRMNPFQFTRNDLFSYSHDIYIYSVFYIFPPRLKSMRCSIGYCFSAIYNYHSYRMETYAVKLFRIIHFNWMDGWMKGDIAAWFAFILRDWGKSNDDTGWEIRDVPLNRISWLVSLLLLVEIFERRFLFFIFNCCNFIWIFGIKRSFGIFHQ